MTEVAFTNLDQNWEAYQVGDMLLCCDARGMEHVVSVGHFYILMEFVTRADNPLVKSGQWLIHVSDSVTLVSRNDSGVYLYRFKRV